MMKYEYSIHHVPEELLYTANTLSHAPSLPATEKLEEEPEEYVDGVEAALPATERQLQEYRDIQKRDEQCSQVIRYCHTENNTSVVFLESERLLSNTNVAILESETFPYCA